MLHILQLLFCLLCNSLSRLSYCSHGRQKSIVSDLERSVLSNANVLIVMTENIGFLSQVRILFNLLIAFLWHLMGERGNEREDTEHMEKYPLTSLKHNQYSYFFDLRSHSMQFSL